MSTPSIPSIPGVDREALADAILRGAWIGVWSANRAAAAALAYIAAHHECACDREHDEWVEVDEGERADLPNGVRLREEWTRGRWEDTIRLFVHRDDMPDADLIERMARAILIHAEPSMPPVPAWEDLPEYGREALRSAARAALAAYREEGR